MTVNVGSVARVTKLEIKTVGVIGSGIMGSGIAEVIGKSAIDVIVR